MRAVAQNPLIKWLYAAIILINITDLFKFLGAPFRVSLQVVGGAMVFFNLGFLVLSLRDTVTTLREKMLWPLVFMVVVWPLVSLCWALDFDLRQVALQIYYCSSVLCGAVFVRRFGFRAFSRVCGAAIWIGLAGFAISILFPTYYDALGYISDDILDYRGRASGFYLQPNKAAEAIILLGTIYLSLNFKNISSTYAIGLLLLFAVLITGSKGGFIILVTTTMLYTYGRLRHSIAGGAASSKRLVLWMMTIAVPLPLFLAVRLLGSLIAGEVAAPQLEDTLAERVIAMTNWRSPEAETFEGGIENRLALHLQYLSLIEERPWTGFGLSAGKWFFLSGFLINASHNSFIEAALSFGLPYSIALILILLLYWFHRKVATLERLMRNNFVRQFVFVIFAASFFSNNVWESRAVYYIFGSIIGLLSIVRDRREPPQSRPVRSCGKRGAIPETETPAMFTLA